MKEARIYVKWDEDKLDRDGLIEAIEDFEEVEEVAFIEWVEKEENGGDEYKRTYYSAQCYDAQGGPRVAHAGCIMDNCKCPCHQKEDK